MLHYLKNSLLSCHDNISSCRGVCELPQNLRVKCGFPDTGKSQLYVEKYSNAPHGVLWGGITANNCTELNISGGLINGTTRLLILKNVLMPTLRIEIRRKCSLLIALSAREFLKGNFPEPWIGRGSPAFPSTSTALTHSLLDLTGLKIVGFPQSECGCKSVHTNKHLLKQPSSP